MGGGPDNVKDACISELTTYALTVARLPPGTPIARRPEGLAAPAERSQLLLQERKAIVQRLAITLIAAFFEVRKDARAMQQQTVALALGFQLFGRELGLALAPAPVGRLDLRFDRLAFPAACHASLYVARCNLLVC
jgi:hypothetical protein